MKQPVVDPAAQVLSDGGAAPAGVAPSLVVPSLGELTAASFKVGCLGFGGPAGQIALMHRVFVDDKKWIDEQRYLHALNYCMLLPGPEAQQLATYVGWLLHGVKGGVIAGGLFVLPGALVVFALSWLYMAAGGEPLVAALFFGVKAAVVALIAEAMIRVGKRALKSAIAWAIAIVTFCALFIWRAPFPLVILGAGLIGLVLVAREGAASPSGAAGGAAPAQTDRVRPAQAFFAAATWLAVWFAPLIAVGLALGPEHVLTRVGQMFSTLAVVTFGGAYATLAYLQQQAVEVEGWLSAGQMIDGLGLAETTPGPLVLVNEFVGFAAGWSAGGLGLATACAAMAAWCTFAPSFVWIFAGAPFAERLRSNRFAKAALSAITAAVLGVIASLAVWFTLHVVFGRIGTLDLALGVEAPAPDFASFDALAALMCLGACIALFRFHVGVIWLVVGCAAAGAALSAVSLV